VAAPMSRHAEQMQRVVIRRIRRENLAIKLFRLVEPACLMQFQRLP
jgi:hypothetical protein